MLCTACNACSSPGYEIFGIGGLKIWRLANATKIAVANGIDRAVAPHASALCGLLHHLHVLVEVNPTAATWALVAQHLLGHEVVRRLDANAHIRHVWATRHLDLFPELVRLRVVL